VNIFLSRDRLGAPRFSVLARTPLPAVAIRLTLLVFDPFPIQQCTVPEHYLPILLFMTKCYRTAFFWRRHSFGASIATSSPILFRNLKQSATVFAAE
jgi:hypothetical protein